MTRKELMNWVHLWRLQSQKLVFTNGCFDLMHRGHVEYLMQAADMGNKLIVGLNSDSSVRKLKGEARPILDEKTRSLILASFSFVSAVCIFEEDTPEDLIHEISPDILVKGGDYAPEQIAGSHHILENQGKVEIIPFVNGFSTSELIEKIRSS